MSLRRALVIGISLIVLLVVVVGVAAFNPSVQRWAVLRAVASQPGLKLEVTRVAAGLGSFEIGGLKVEQDGIRLEIATLKGEYGLWPMVAGRQVEIPRITARGVVIDLTRLSPAEAQAGATVAPAAAPGVISRLRLPLGIVLGECDIEGRALLPGPAGQPAVTAEYRLTGGRIAPGAEGSLRLEARVANSAPEPRVKELRAQVDLKLHQSLQQTFDRIGIAAVVDGEGPAVPANSQLRIVADLANTAAGETYALTVETIRAGKADRLWALNARLPAGGDRFAGDWALNVRTAQVEPYFLGGALPQFEARGAGDFSFAPVSGALAWKGWLEASAHGLEALQPALRPIGVIEVESGFDIEWTGSSLVLNRLDATVIGDRPILSIHTAQVVRADFSGENIQVNASAPGEVLRIKVPGLPLAWVRPFVPDADVSGGVLSGEFAVSTNGRRLTATSIVPVRIDTLNVVQAGRALLLNASVSVDLEAFLDENRWQGQVRQFSLETPTGDRLTAQLTANAARDKDAAIHLVGSYETRLPALLEPWLPGLKTQTKGEFDVTLGTTLLSVAKFTGEVRVLDGAPMLAVASRQPFQLDLTTRQFAAADGKGGDLLNVDLGRIDLAPLIGGYPSGLSGTITGGGFALGTVGDQWLFRSARPLTIAGFDLTEPGRPPGLGGLTIQLEPQIELAADASLKAQSGDLTIKLPDGTLVMGLKGEVLQSAAGLRASANFAVELPVLSRLPAFAAANALVQGRATGEVRAALEGGTQQAEARITLNGLVARAGGQPLPVANISFRGVHQADGSATVEVPVLFDRSGIRSDLKFTASLARSGTGHRLDAKLAGEHASLEDILAVMGVFSSTAAGQTEPAKPTPVAPARAAAAPARPPVPVVADTMPPWHLFTGRVAFDIKSVTHGKEWAMTGLSGLLVVDPASVSLERLEAGLGGKSRFATKGALRFGAGAQPYKLTGEVTLTEFDAAPVFKALEPGRPPTVEGIFAINGRMESAGRTIDETVERARGEFQLTSRQGVFRGLKRGTEKLSVASKAVELGAALGSLFGSDKVREAASKVAGNAYFADQIAQELGELKYDQLAVRLSRDDALNVRLSEVSMISPEVRLVGKGTITHVAGTPLLEQPLSVEATIASRGKLGELFNRARLLENAVDELGYYRVKYPVVIGGSMAKPDAVAFYTRLAASKLIENFSGEN